MVADAAARGIREIDDNATIGILSADVDEPYTRPALSKKLWTDPDFTWDQVPLGTAEDTRADIRLKAVVTEIDRDGRTVLVGDGERVGYRRLLLATGSRPHEVDAPDSDRVLFFRSAEDYRRLRELATEARRIVVVGGGYIGAELAAGLVQNDVEVDLVFPSRTLGDGTFPPQLADRYEGLFRDAGVRLVAGRRVDEVVAGESDADGPDAVLDVVLDDGSRLRGDAVVLGLGVSPVTDLAEQAGLTVDDGVVVDESLATSDDAIWAAGDIASYPDRLLGRTRVEHVDNAQEMGRAAGRSMAGSGEAYRHTPYFYSQVFGVRWEAVGTLDPDLDTLVVEVGDDEAGARTVVYYRDESGAPVGVLLWNVADATDAARLVLAEAPTDEAEQRGRIS
ncbi:MAG: FAD-dependent oxidoreductase [Microbacterium sp.]|nr:FAD-dependent oxidoreductase [Microbacterium sp.]